MLDKERIKQELDEQDITIILKDLGSSEPHIDKDHNLIYQTVCHNSHEGSYKLYYYTDSKLFKCYTECQDTFDIYELVRRSKIQNNIRLSFYECIKYVASLTNKNIHISSILSSEKDYLIDDWQWIKNYKRAVKPTANLSIINETILDVFHEIYYEPWINEGITIETMYKFGIKYYIKDDKIVIPHYNINNQLIGIRGRSLRPDDIVAGRKYMPLIVENKTYNHPLALNLYGLNHTIDTIKRIKKIAIFEAEKSVMQCETMFENNNFSVACCGMNLSKWQIETILSLNVEEVFLCLDKQYQSSETKEAYKFGEKLISLASKFAPYVRTYILWDDENLLPYKASPSDLGKDILIQLMKNKLEVKTKDGQEIEICNTN